MKEEEKIARVIGLMKQTESPKEAAPTRRKPLPALGNKVVIHGNVNHFAGGKTSVKVVVVAPPGSALISKAQKADLVEKRDQWVERHNAIEAHQITRNDARKALNAKARVTAHRFIPAARYADLVRWLDARIAALRTTEQRLTESNRRDLGALRPPVATSRDANPDTDLTPPHAERPPPCLYQVKAPNAGYFVPTNTLTPGIRAGKPGILCQTQIARLFSPPTPQTLAQQAFQPHPPKFPPPPPCANCPPPSQSERSRVKRLGFSRPLPRQVLQTLNQLESLLRARLDPPEQPSGPGETGRAAVCLRSVCDTAADGVRIDGY